MKFTTTLILISLLFMSCSRQNVRTKRVLTEREKILERYRMLRLKNWKRKPVRRIRKRPNYKVVSIRPKRAAKRRMVDPQAQRIEIEQNLSFFCMENRKDKRFNDEGSCQRFTEDIIVNCSLENKEGDPRLTTCVKSRLK